MTKLLFAAWTNKDNIISFRSLIIIKFELVLFNRNLDSKSLENILSAKARLCGKEDSFVVEAIFSFSVEYLQCTK